MIEERFDPKRKTTLLPGTLKNLFYPPEKDEYAYFKGASANPFRKDARKIVKAAWAADAAMLSYARYGPLRMTEDELKSNLACGGLKLEKTIGVNPSDWNAPGTQAFFATGDGFAILAFRGTEADDPSDTHVDLDLLLVHEPDYRGAATPRLGYLSLVEHLLTPCLVHQGFQSALNSVWSQVQGTLTAYRAGNRDAEICLTGHSLGGALALLTYSRLADLSTSLFTIGCPRVGNNAFRKRVASCHGMGHFRAVNQDDLVTHVPLESALYQHCPIGSYRIDTNGGVYYTEEDTIGADLSVLTGMFEGLPSDFEIDAKALADRPAPPGLVDHSPARYCMQLWDCA